jgi:hypothetical protein
MPGISVHMLLNTLPLTIGSWHLSMLATFEVSCFDVKSSPFLQATNLISGSTLSQPDFQLV